MINLSKIPLASPTFIDEKTGEDVYIVHRTYGAIEFRVASGTEVRMQEQSWSGRPSGEPRSTFPNMEARDGALIIPVSDVVNAIVARTEPRDLARELWADEGVREEFLYCLTNRFSDDNMSDADRRNLLHELKSEVHSAAIDTVARRLHSMEHGERERWVRREDLYSFQQYYRNILESIESAFGVEARERLETIYGKAFNGGVSDRKDYDIGQKHWNESRDYWRATIEKIFAGPEEPDANIDQLIA